MRFNKALKEFNIEISGDNTQRPDKEALRVAIASELSAINLYESLAAKTSTPEIEKVLLDVAEEEKTHVGEFQGLLKKIDPSFTQELTNGENELVEAILPKDEVVLLIGENAYSYHDKNKNKKYIVGVFEKDSKLLQKIKGIAKANYDKVYEIELEYKKLLKIPFEKIFTFLQQKENDDNEV